jgi:hypothetical protein
MVLVESEGEFVVPQEIEFIHGKRTYFADFNHFGKTSDTAIYYQVEN